MKMINEWKNKEYVTRWYYSFSLIGLQEFDEKTQELIKKIVLEDEQASNKTDEMQYIQKYAEYYKSKGYADEDIKIVKTYYVGADEDKLIYDIELKVSTEHSEFDTYVTAGREVKLTSQEFNKERNELGEKIKSKVQLIKLRKQNEELKEKINKLEEELKKYKNDEDENDE